MEWNAITIDRANFALASAGIHDGGTDPDDRPQGQTLTDAVQYVPCSAWLPVDGRRGVPIDFALSGGTLPDGFSLSPEGELYGVPICIVNNYENLLFFGWNCNI